MKKILTKDNKILTQGGGTVGLFQTEEPYIKPTCKELGWSYACTSMKYDLQSLCEQGIPEGSTICVFEPPYRVFSGTTSCYGSDLRGWYYDACEYLSSSSSSSSKALSSSSSSSLSSESMSLSSSSFSSSSSESINLSSSSSSSSSLECYCIAKAHYFCDKDIGVWQVPTYNNYGCGRISYGTEWVYSENEYTIEADLWYAETNLCVEPICNDSLNNCANFTPSYPLSPIRICGHSSSSSSSESNSSSNSLSSSSESSSDSSSSESTTERMYCGTELGCYRDNPNGFGATCDEAIANCVGCETYCINTYGASCGWDCNWIEGASAYEASVCCVRLRGSCCVGTECIPDLYKGQCINEYSGVWQGAGTTCSPNPCSLSSSSSSISLSSSSSSESISLSSSSNSSSSNSSSSAFEPITCTGCSITFGVGGAELYEQAITLANTCPTACENEGLIPCTMGYFNMTYNESMGIYSVECCCESSSSSSLSESSSSNSSSSSLSESSSSSNSDSSSSSNSSSSEAAVYDCTCCKDAMFTYACNNLYYDNSASWRVEAGNESAYEGSCGINVWGDTTYRAYPDNVFFPDSDGCIKQWKTTFGINKEGFPGSCSELCGYAFSAQPNPDAPTDACGCQGPF